MHEIYPTIEDPWVDPFEDIFVCLWILNWYLRSPFDSLNVMFQPNSKINWKVVRQNIISQKKK
jgi:hypothetical protein